MTYDYALGEKLLKQLYPKEVALGGLIESVDCGELHYLLGKYHDAKFTATQQKLDVAVDALEFYKKLENYMAELKEGDEGQRPYFDFKCTPIHVDSGKVAKTALASIKDKA
jgi:hypothetical protein